MHFKIWLAITVLLSPLWVQNAMAQSCDPNYEGACVPVASDVDCAGGSGNGSVRVVGRDVYGLDRDKDGIGCE